MIDYSELCDKWFRAADDKQVNERIERDIEKYRKGFCKIRLTDESGSPLKNAAFTVRQTKHDFKYGANIFQLDEFDSADLNKAYREAFKRYFNLATVPFYWNGLEPEQGKPRFDKNSPRIYRRPATERCLEYCEENAIDAKLHCLVYDKFIPDWLPLADEKKMEDAYEERFRQIAERYSGRLWEVEVINELLCEWAWKYKSAISAKPDIIEWAFGLARKYFQNEVLTVNECNTLGDLSRQGYRHPYYLMVQNALRAGACIDRIGLQHHLFAGAPCRTEKEYEDHVLRDEKLYELADPTVVFKGLDYIATLGKPLEITEVTIPMIGDGVQAEEMQARLVNILYSVWFAHPAVDAVVYWNVPDGYAHVNTASNWNENNCHAGLLNHDLSPRKAAEELERLFTKQWHTELDLTTDENGYADFRGFWGEYELKAGGSMCDFAIHAGCDNCFEIEV